MLSDVAVNSMKKDTKYRPSAVSVVFALIFTALLFSSALKKSNSEIVIIETDTDPVTETAPPSSAEAAVVRETVISEHTAIPETSAAAATAASAACETSVVTAIAETECIATGIATEYIAEVLYLDINTAAADELMQLPGIGDVLSGMIVAYREEHGGFRNTEEIMQVSGIGEGIFSAISPYIYVADPVYEDYEPPDIDISGDTPDIQDEPEIIQETVPEDSGEQMQLTLEDAAPININTADTETLMLLPYVSHEEAEAIIRLREEINGFRDPYELLFVEELDRQQVAEITEYVTVGE